MFDMLLLTNWYFAYNYSQVKNNGLTQILLQIFTLSDSQSMGRS